MTKVAQFDLSIRSIVGVRKHSALILTFWNCYYMYSICKLCLGLNCNRCSMKMLTTMYHKLRSYSFLFFWANLMQFEVILKLTRAILANQDGPI